MHHGVDAVMAVADGAEGIDDLAVVREIDLHEVGPRVPATSMPMTSYPWARSSRATTLPSLPDDPVSAMRMSPEWHEDGESGPCGIHSSA